MLARHTTPPPSQGRMVRAREVEQANGTIQNARAARTVASHALDAEDCRCLLGMLGLDASDGKQQVADPEVIETPPAWFTAR